MKEKIKYIIGFTENNPSYRRGTGGSLAIKFPNLSKEENNRLDLLYRADWKAYKSDYYNLSGPEINKGILYVNLVYKLLKDLENDRIRENM